METYKFHNVRKGATYQLKVDKNGVLFSVTTTKIGQRPFTASTFGEPVLLDDLEITIGNTLRGKGSENPEFRAILEKIQKKV